MKNFLTFIFLTISSSTCCGQKYLLANEQIIYSFNTINGKRMVLAKDSTNKYIVYRFGTKEKIEIEFPSDIKDSWRRFTYSYYLRGGGKQNEGLDLNYVYFVSNNSKYIIYYTYSAREQKSKCGIKVIDIVTKKMVDIKGKTKSINGSIIDFRDNNLLEIGDELFD